MGPRAGGRVEKIFAWEGDHLHEGQLIVQLDASELRARRDLAVAQIDTAIHDADAQGAQLQFLRDDARRQQDLLKRKVVSPNDAERADSSAKSQEKNAAAAKMRLLKRLTPTPQLPVFLEIAPHESFARKGEYSVDYLSRRWAAYRTIAPWVRSAVVLTNEHLGETEAALGVIVRDRLTP